MNPAILTHKKTTFLKSIIEELKGLGIADENIIYISLENVKYRHIKTSKELDEVVLDKVKDIEGKVYLLFDEIQLVDEWKSQLIHIGFLLIVIFMLLDLIQNCSHLNFQHWSQEDMFI